MKNFKEIESLGDSNQPYLNPKPIYQKPDSIVEKEKEEEEEEEEEEKKISINRQIGELFPTYLIYRVYVKLVENAFYLFLKNLEIISPFEYSQLSPQSAKLKASEKVKDIYEILISFTDSFPELKKNPPEKLEVWAIITIALLCIAFGAKPPSSFHLKIPYFDVGTKKRVFAIISEENILGLKLNLMNKRFYSFNFWDNCKGGKKKNLKKPPNVFKVFCTYLRPFIKVIMVKTRIYSSYYEKLKLSAASPHSLVSQHDFDNLGEGAWYVHPIFQKDPLVKIEWPTTFRVLDSDSKDLKKIKI